MTAGQYPEGGMLTIGQLADYVGVTVRAIRHYHQRGLLPEPDRDASGYRRYGAQAVTDLIRIKTLSDAGVPLARIAELLEAEPGQFARAVRDIDQALAARIRDLEEQRHRIAELAAGDRLFLPPEVAEYLDELRRIGVSQRLIKLERDGWIVLAARLPEQVTHWAREKRRGVATPEGRRLYLAWDQAFGWGPDDPRLGQLADDLVAFAKLGESMRADEPAYELDDPVAVALLSQPGISAPAWERVLQLCEERGYPLSP
ncbi:MAG TPA: MerR family transcriptional regulator [Streptosporangiaceae bacterium]|nr:MerR family transcriptional regulator [Streptosporangiaceae bacterium]